MVRPEMLVSRVANVLREKIHTRHWGEFLPGERRLSERLGVSRGTVREALAHLRREGLIAVAVGRQTRISARPARRRPATSRIVGLVTNGPLLGLSPTTVYQVGELRQQLQQAGFELQIFSEQQDGTRDLRRIVKNLLNEQRICCWLLVSVSEGLQRWCERQKLCAVVVGSSFDEVQLPSIDYDYAALARHAVGLLAGRGHQRLALLRPADVTAGFLAGESGFFQGIKDVAERRAVRGTVWRLKDEPEAVFNQIDRIMAQAEAPTGLVVTRTVHAVSVASKLLTLGRKIPQEVSLICLTEDPHLRGFHPAIAAYRLAPRIFAERLRRIVLQAATTGDLAPRRHFIRPELAPGGSIAQAPTGG